MVGKSCFATLGSANSFGIRVSALTSKGRSVCSFGSTGGGYCVWPLCIKADCCGPLQTVRWFRQSDRKPVGLPFRLQRENISILSCIPTKRNQLSTDVRRSPFLSRKELRMELCPLAGFRMLTCIRKNSAFPLQSRRLCTASSRRLAEQGQSLVLAGY